MSSQGPPVVGNAGRASSFLDAEAETWAEVKQRIAFLESPDYDDQSKRILTNFDWTWIILAGAVAPLALFVWGALLL